MGESELRDAAVNLGPESHSVGHALIRGSIGFALVSLAAFSVWAFGGKLFRGSSGEIWLYGACTLVFVALSGVLLHPLVRGPGSLLRFYSVFIPAFLGYAVVWCIAWFALRFGPGEWLGSFLGSIAFVGVISWRMHNAAGFLKTSLVVFVLHSVGYFAGGYSMHWLLGHGGSALFSGFSKHSLGIVAKLAWGLLYGLGFGAGIGYAFHKVQSRG